ncbi:hypothetical protein CFN78_16665 [Amycolatopsis antarctica]|uniref:Uncharacterized protein n=2 Tax=Amycolatopsis antarctica TaxID=1854586 RepID=A0A263D1A5_9PSEU|nr:hypothetical protein CFN78_16665 [Amycolatopsis antarctica]
MLAGVAEALAADGWNVVLPSRRYSPIPGVPAGPGVAARAALRRPGHRPDVPAATGRAIWVEADWSRPAELAAAAGTALGGRADLLVAWVHPGYRAAVLDAVAPLLAEGAPAVEVILAPPSPRIEGEGRERSALDRHPVHRVVLGRRPARRLTHAEIVHGVLAAVRRAVAGSPPAAYDVRPPPA